MVRAVSLLIVLTACGGSKPKAIGNTAPGSATGSYESCERVEGVVVDAENKPLVGVTVVLSGGDNEEDLAITDENGAFAITARIRRTKLRLMFVPEEPLDPPFEGCRGLRIRFTAQRPGEI